MGDRAVLTIKGHATTIKHMVQNSRSLRKMPTIPRRGPMPIGDDLGMGMAMDML
jgi:hypothetical protein